MKKLKVPGIIKWWQTFEKYPKTSWGFSLLWLLLIIWLAFLWNLGNIGLVDETEPLFAEAARQMTVTGDWITPYFNGETRFDKPPLIYWLMAIAYQLIGVNEWAVRLPSALAAIALVIFSFFTLRYFGFATSSTQTTTKNYRQIQRQLWLSAWISSALIAFTPQLLVWARIGVSDMLLSACVAIALLCFFWGYTKQEQEDKKIKRNNLKSSQDESPPNRSFKLQPANGWYFSFYIMLALAVLTKGPVGIVLPGLIILVFLLYVGKFREVLQEVGIISGMLIFLLLTLPWYILVILRNGNGYIESFFGYHNFERFTDVVNGHSAPWYFYFLVILLGFAPWSLYLPLAIARIRIWQVSFWRNQNRSAQLSLFVFFWFTGIFIFFTIAVTKLPSYVIPLLPSAAILVALLWSEEMTNEWSTTPKEPMVKASLLRAQNRFRKNRGLLISGIINCLFLIILAIAFIYSPNFIGYDPAAPNLPELLIQSQIPLRGAIIWGITAILITLLLTIRPYWQWLGVTNLIGFVTCFILVLIPATIVMDQVRQLPLRQLSATVTQVAQVNEELWMIGFTKPSLVFYTQRPVEFFDQTRQVISYLKETFNNQPNSTSVLILCRSKHIKRMNLKPQDYQNLGNQEPYKLIRVTKQKILQALRG